MPFPSRTVPLSSLAAAALALSACSAAPAAPPSSPTSEPPRGTDRREVASLFPRVLMAFDGGLMTLDTGSGDLRTTAREGFLRLSDAGDGRHVVVSDGDAFRLFDSGLVAHGHGDHHHYYVQNPGMTGAELEAPEAGHVVAHGGRTALFADGTGEVRIVDSADLASGRFPRDADRRAADSAHHGVAVPLSGGGLLVTQGDAGHADAIQVLGPDGGVVAETTDCPGVHGEATARPTGRGDVVVLGCENGPVLYRDGAFHKVPVPEAYQRSGNLAGSPASPVVLADYKTDPEAELERPTRIGLIDTRTARMRTVDLGSSYWFRSLARGPEGEALVLTYDGELNILDPGTGKVLHEPAVVEPWKEKPEWQQPGPAVETAGGKAYVTDAAAQRLHVVDIASGTVEESFALPETPNEVAVVTGEPEHAGG